jgi:hypothetical protein
MGSGSIQKKGNDMAVFKCPHCKELLKITIFQHIEKPKPKTIAKIKYAEYVHMTEAQYKTLVEKHGEKAAKRMIEILDNYKGSKGKLYKDDYRAILSWVVDRFNEEIKRVYKPIERSYGPKGIPTSIKEMLNR